MDGGHLWREILLLLLVWQLVESVELWQVVRKQEQLAKKGRVNMSLATMSDG
jgi:hypothetical protein